MHTSIHIRAAIAATIIAVTTATTAHAWEFVHGSENGKVDNNREYWGTILPENDIVSDLLTGGRHPVDMRLFIENDITMNAFELEFLQVIAQSPYNWREQVYTNGLSAIYTRLRTDDMYYRNYYSHFIPIELQPEGERWGAGGQVFVPNMDGYRVGLSYSGEDIALGYSDPKALHQAYYDSFGHREIMLGGDPANPESWNSHLHDNILGVGYTEYYNALHMNINLCIGEDHIHREDYVGDSPTKRFRIEQTQFYRLFTPSGQQVDPNYNWVTSRVAGIERTHWNPDGTYTSHWFGNFRNYGGGFVKHDRMGLVYIYPHRTTMPDYISSVGTPNLTGWGKHPLQTIRRDDVGYSIFVPNRGWLWQNPGPDERNYYAATRTPGEIVRNRKAPSNTYWSTSRNGWIHVDTRYPDGGIYNYPNSMWEDWIPNGPYAVLETDKRQIFHGEAVVFAWDSNTTAGQNGHVVVRGIDPTGAVAVEYEALIGAAGWNPAGTGMHQVVLTHTDSKGTVTTQTREVNVLPNPAPNAWVGIEASTATAAIGEAYSVGWNSTGGGVAIVRVTPGRDANSPDGVFSNATSGHAVFVNHAPGRYCYSIQMGQAYHQVVVEVTGEPTLPDTPPAKK